MEFPSLDKEGWRGAPGWFETVIPQVRLGVLYVVSFTEDLIEPGFVEGLNNKLKLLKRRCFGLDDPIKLFQRLWLDIEGARHWL